MSTSLPFIIKNGHGELVVMSQACYEQIEARVELYERLAMAAAEEAAGARRMPHRTVIPKLPRRIRGKAR